MAQFLHESFDGTLQELVQLKRDKDFDSIKASVLLAQLSFLGMLKELPLVLKELKTQFDARKEAIEINRKRAEDPLAEG